MRFGQFNGSVDQRVADLGLRFNGDLGPDITSSAGRVKVDPATLTGPEVLHIIFDGQSNNDNVVFDGPYEMRNPSKIFNMSIGHEGAVFEAREPLLSSDDTKSHNAFPLADKLIEAGLAGKVIISNIAIGGRWAASSVPGGYQTGTGLKLGHLAYRLGLAQRCIVAAGLNGVRTIIDWAQGETETDSGPTSQAQYQEALALVIAEMKLRELLRPGRVLFVHKTTRPGALQDSRDAIRAGQQHVVDGDLVRAGIDMDLIVGNHPVSGLPLRWTDGTHFRLPGADLLAEGKRDLIADWMAEG